MPSPTSILGLIPELQELIIKELAFPDVLSYRWPTVISMQSSSPLNICNSSRQKRRITPSRRMYTHAMTVSVCARHSDLRITWLKSKRSRDSGDARKRFYVECGVHSPPGTTRYMIGAHIMIQNVFHVICLRCAKFSQGIKGDSENPSLCCPCWATIQAQKEEQRMKQKRAQAKTEQVARRARRHEIWHSDHEDSDDLPPNPTWSELGIGYTSS